MSTRAQTCGATFDTDDGGRYSCNAKLVHGAHDGNHRDPDGHEWFNEPAGWRENDVEDDDA